MGSFVISCSVCFSRKSFNKVWIQTSTSIFHQFAVWRCCHTFFSLFWLSPINWLCVSRRYIQLMNASSSLSSHFIETPFLAFPLRKRTMQRALCFACKVEITEKKYEQSERGSAMKWNSWPPNKANLNRSTKKLLESSLYCGSESAPHSSS